MTIYNSSNQIRGMQIRSKTVVMKYKMNKIGFYNATRSKND